MKDGAAIPPTVETELCEEQNKVKIIEKLELEIRNKEKVQLSDEMSRVFQLGETHFTKSSFQLARESYTSAIQHMKVYINLLLIIHAQALKIIQKEDVVLKVIELWNDPKKKKKSNAKSREEIMMSRINNAVDQVSSAVSPNNSNSNSPRNSIHERKGRKSSTTAFDIAGLHSPNNNKPKTKLQETKESHLKQIKEQNKRYAYYLFS